MLIVFEAVADIGPCTGRDGIRGSGGRDFRKRAMNPFRPGVADAGGLGNGAGGGFNLVGSARLADMGMGSVRSARLGELPDDGPAVGLRMSSGNGVTSSPLGMCCFCRMVPRNFLNREPILLDVCMFCGEGEAVGERNGIASTLVDADTRVGEEILFGLIRFRGALPEPSAILGIEGDLRRAAVEASALS